MLIFIQKSTSGAYLVALTKHTACTLLSFFLGRSPHVLTLFRHWYCQSGHRGESPSLMFQRKFSACRLYYFLTYLLLYYTYTIFTLPFKALTASIPAQPKRICAGTHCLKPLGGELNRTLQFHHATLETVTHPSTNMAQRCLTSVIYGNGLLSTC